MSEENKALIRHYIEENYNQKNRVAADALFASDFVNHARGTDTDLVGLQQNRAMFSTAFPDLHLTIDHMLDEDDQVMARVTLSATHSGVFMGIAPRGKRAVWTGIDVFRIAEGKIGERWVAVDTLGLLQQLGAEVK